MPTKRLLVTYPHGFCSGVTRAVAAAEAAVSRYASPVYGLHEIVHNAQVIAALGARGLHVVERLDDIPTGAVVLFSAHGVSPAIREESCRRQLRIIDATCPFVAKVHREVLQFVAEDCDVVCIGHRTHAEVIGIVGEAPDHVLVVENESEAWQVHPADPNRVGVVSQTTLTPELTDGVLAILRTRFPHLRHPLHHDICYATRNRQQAVRVLAAQVELLLVLGSPNSSNSRRLVETARQAGCPAQLIGTGTELAGVPLENIQILGIASGASTPESFLQELLTALARRGFPTVEPLYAVPENTHAFRLPPMPE
jgi:4-hydroxy-3-methylbut-2-enyl diphosphate reductase